MEDRSRRLLKKGSATGILLVLALVLTSVAQTLPGPSADERIVKAIYFAAASMIVAMAVLVWARD